MAKRIFQVNSYDCCHPKDIEKHDVFKTSLLGATKVAIHIDDGTIFFCSLNSKHTGSMSAISQQLLYLVKSKQ